MKESRFRNELDPAKEDKRRELQRCAIVDQQRVLHTGKLLTIGMGKREAVSTDRLLSALIVQVDGKLARKYDEVKRCKTTEELDIILWSI